MFGSIKASLRLNQAHSWRLIQPESVTALTSAREPPCISRMTSANPRPAESLVNQGFLSLRSGPNTRAWHFQVQPPASTDSQTLRSWFCSPGQDKEPNPRKGKQDGPSQTSQDERGFGKSTPNNKQTPHFCAGKPQMKLKVQIYRLHYTHTAGQRNSVTTSEPCRG